MNRPDWKIVVGLSDFELIALPVSQLASEIALNVIWVC